MKKKSAKKPLTKRHKKDNKAAEAAQKAEQAKQQQFLQKTAVVAQQILKVEGAADGIDSAVREMTSTMPKLLKDKTVVASLKKIYKSKVAAANEDEALIAVSNWIIQKVVLGLSDMSGELGKQVRQLNGTLSLLQLEKNSTGGQDGSDFGEVKG